MNDSAEDGMVTAPCKSDMGLPRNHTCYSLDASLRIDAQLGIAIV